MRTCNLIISTNPTENLQVQLVVCARDGEGKCKVCAQRELGVHESGDSGGLSEETEDAG